MGFNLPILVLFLHLSLSLQIDQGGMNGYFNLSQVYSEMENLQGTYPSLVSLTYMNTTFNFNKLYYLRISTTNSSTGKGIIVVSASQTSGFPISTSAALYIAQQFLNQTTDSSIQELLQTRDIYIFPLMNPDAYSWTQTQFSRGLGFMQFLTNRKNTGCQSLSGNGVNLNRNWPYMWNTTGDSSPDGCNSTYPGTAPLSEVETLSVARAISQLNPVSWIHFENIGNKVEFPYTYSKVQDYPENMYYNYQLIASFYNDTMQIGTSYSLFNGTEDGSLIDYYASMSTASFQVAVGSSFLNQSSIKPALDIQYSKFLDVFKASGVELTFEPYMLGINNCPENCVNPNSTYEVNITYFINNTNIGFGNAFILNISLSTNSTSNMPFSFIGVTGYYTSVITSKLLVIDYLLASTSSSGFAQVYNFSIPAMTNIMIEIIISTNSSDSSKAVEISNELSIWLYEFSMQALSEYTVNIGKNSSSDRLSKGSVAAIVICSILGAAIFGIAVYCCRRRRQRLDNSEKEVDQA